MMVLSRKIGQTFYIQPLIGDLLVIKVLAVFIKNNVKVARLCVQKLDLEKIAHRIKKCVNIKIKGNRKRFTLLEAVSQASPMLKNVKMSTDIKSLSGE